MKDLLQIFKIESTQIKAGRAETIEVETFANWC